MPPAVPSLRRARTDQLESLSVDFLVLQHSCVDSSAIPALGSHKESHWVVSTGSDAQPLDIRLTVDTSVVKNPEVGIICDGKVVFPDPSLANMLHSRGMSSPNARRGSGGEKAKAKIHEDFVWEKAFRGKIQGLNKRHFYEVRPEHLTIETWYPATIVEQRQDGLFKANITIPNGWKGEKTVVYPAVSAENIRVNQGTRPKLVVPRRTITLRVPKLNPMLATLTLDGGELMTHYFARPTPPPKVHAVSNEPVCGKIPRQKVRFVVSKDRKVVTSEVGHAVLARFLSGEARAVNQTCEPLKHTWTIQLGPYATHVVELEKKYRSSRVVTLVVDGTTLAEASAEDLESPDGFWLCSFRFVGEKSLEWEVFESDGHGFTTDTKGIVEQVSIHHRTCSVYCTPGERLVDARFVVDGQDFTALKPAGPEPKEEPLKVQPEALVMSYNMHVPYKCKNDVMRKDGTIGQKKPTGLLGFFYCCGTGGVDPNSDLVMNSTTLTHYVKH